MLPTIRPSRRWWRRLSYNGAGSMCSSPMPAGGRGRPVDTKASTLDPALLHLVTAMNLFGTVYTCNAVAPVMKRQDHHGKLGRPLLTLR